MKKLLCMLLLIQCGFMMAQSQTETVVTPNGKKVTFNPNSLNTANNGLTATGGNIQLGGVLTKPSVLTTTSAFTLALKGLQTGAATDSIVVTDTNGILKLVTQSSLGDNLGNHTATQTLNMSANDINAAKDITATGTAAAANVTASTKATVATAAITKGTDGLAPAAGYLATSVDALGNVVWKSPATIVSANQVQADWNMATDTDPAFIKNKPTIPTITGAETIINQGTNITITGTGTSASPYIVNATSTADNLGNHTATQTLNMSANDITAAKNITATGTAAAANVTASTKATVATAAITTGTDGSVPAAGYVATAVDALGNIKWTNPSALAVTGDNLGNHTATQTLNMSANDINAAKDITATGTAAAANVTASTKATVATAAITKGTDGLAPAAGYLATSVDALGNVVWKSPATIVSANQVQADWNMATDTDPAFIKNKPTIPTITGAETIINQGTNITITGTGTTASPYIVNATSTADNLGNHTATQTLNMSANDITAAKNITATGTAAAANVTASTKATVATAAITTGTDGSVPAAGYVATAVDALGNIKWTNPSALAVTGDNLGNHTATQTLNMSANDINAAKDITATGTAAAANVTASTKATVATAAITKGTDGLAPAAGYLATSVDALGNVVWKSPATIVSANQVQADWNMATDTDPAFIKNKPVLPTALTADNGLAITANKVQLGGSLTKATALTTTATNTLAIEGLQTGAATDNIVVADATSGVLKTVTGSSMQIEPWQEQGTTNKATSNTAKIYQMGAVAIGTNDMLGSTNANVKLAVNGAIITPTSYYADYVFEDYLDGKSEIKSAYSFKSLSEVDKYIAENKHLPGVTSIKDLARNEKGEYIFNITDLSIQSLEKIEELYLHTIEQQKQLEANEKTMKEMNDRIERLEKLVKGNN